MIYEFTGLDGQKLSTTDANVAAELTRALKMSDFEVSTFDPSSNGTEFVYRSPEEQEKDQCYTAWGYQ
jgi:hypothetical protein